MTKKNKLNKKSKYQESIWTLMESNYNTNFLPSWVVVVPADYTGYLEWIYLKKETRKM